MGFFTDFVNLHKALFELDHFQQLSGILDLAKIKVDDEEDMDELIVDLDLDQKDCKELQETFKYARNSCNGEIVNITAFITSLLADADKRNMIGGYILRLIADFFTKVFMPIRFEIYTCKLFGGLYYQKIKDEAHYYVIACEDRDIT